MKLRLVQVAVMVLSLTGCEMVDSQMWQQLGEYFPQAEIAHPRPDGLAVITHVPNVTKRFVSKRWQLCFVNVVAIDPVSVAF